MQVKQALAEIFKMLKPGGKLLLFEAHVVQYLEWDDKATIPLRHVWVTPKADGTRWGYFEDEGKPREVLCYHLEFVVVRMHICLGGFCSALDTFSKLKIYMYEFSRVIAPKHHDFGNAFWKWVYCSIPTE